MGAARRGAPLSLAALLSAAVWVCLTLSLPLGADRTQAFVSRRDSSVEQSRPPERGPAARLWPISCCSPPSRSCPELARCTFGTWDFRRPVDPGGSSWVMGDLPCGQWGCVRFGLQHSFPQVPVAASCSSWRSCLGSQAPGDWVLPPCRTPSQHAVPMQSFLEGLGMSLLPRLLPGFPPRGRFCGPAVVTGVHQADGDGLCSPHRGVCLVPDTGG